MAHWAPPDPNTHFQAQRNNEYTSVILLTVNRLAVARPQGGMCPPRGETCREAVTTSMGVGFLAQPWFVVGYLHGSHMVPPARHTAVPNCV